MVSGVREKTFFGFFPCAELWEKNLSREGHLKKMTDKGRAWRHQGTVSLSSEQEEGSLQENLYLQTQFGIRSPLFVLEWPEFMRSCFDPRGPVPPFEASSE